MIKCTCCQKETHNKKYCSIVCQKDFERSLIVAAGTANIRALKRFLLKRDGHKCKICNMTEWINEPIPLVIDHIDGNSENSELINLRLICCNCDATLPTYKNRNYGNGRHSRRLRYRNLQSY